MFLDFAKIYVKSGDGGSGIVSFRREKYVPRGGPDGGDGGRGGHIIFKVDPGQTTLSDFRYSHHFKAESGRDGEAVNRSGRNGSDLIIKVPSGTIIKENETDKILADLTDYDDEFILVKGGRGGRGNSNFATPTRQAPRIAEKGELGREVWLTLELKVLADVGFIGYPNVGKSTLISRVSAARPKIADYPFTTLEPNLGVVDHKGKSFVAVDIPGLIEGAHEGVGLGLQFLRHIERTRVLVHLIDVSGFTGRDPYEDYLQINNELKQYNEKLADKLQLIVLNKCDLPGSAELVDEFCNKVKDAEILKISAATGEGVNQLLDRLIALLEQIPPDLQQFVPEPLDDGPIDATVTIERDDEAAFVVKCDSLLRRVQRYDMSNDDALRSLHSLLKRWKIYDALREAGAHEGDTVKINDFEFEYLDEEW